MEKEAKSRAEKESELVKMVRADEDEERSGEGVGLLDDDEVSERASEQASKRASDQTSKRADEQTSRRASERTEVP